MIGVPSWSPRMVLSTVIGPTTRLGSTSLARNQSTTWQRCSSLISWSWATTVTTRRSTGCGTGMAPGCCRGRLMGRWCSPTSSVPVTRLTVASRTRSPGWRSTARPRASSWAPMVFSLTRHLLLLPAPAGLLLQTREPLRHRGPNLLLLCLRSMLFHPGKRRLRVSLVRDGIGALAGQGERLLGELLALLGGELGHGGILLRRVWGRLGRAS